MFHATPIHNMYIRHFERIEALPIVLEAEAAEVPEAEIPESRNRLTLARGEALVIDPGAIPLTSPVDDPAQILTRFRAGFKSGSVKEYIPLSDRPGLTDDSPCWRVEFYGIAPGTEPLGFDILGDVVIGRGEEADLNLEPYLGYEQAVSRRHALLRPSRHRLHLIDLGSTNGTLCNTVPISVCSSHPLQSDDLITLGILTFRIRIIDGPRMRA